MFSLTDYAKETLDFLYKEVPSGYSISTEDRQQIDPEGKGATYGEITFHSFQHILRYFAPTAEDVFVDLGSGTGKAVFQTLLTSSVKYAIGVEASIERDALARQVSAEMRKNLLPNERPIWDQRLRLVKGDFLKKDLSDVTIVYLCGTCFSEEMLGRICDKLKASPNLRSVVSLAQLPSPAVEGWLDKEQEQLLSTSWSAGSPVYFYRSL